MVQHLSTPGSSPATCQLPSTTGIYTSIPPCSVLQGREAQGFRIVFVAPLRTIARRLITAKSRQSRVTSKAGIRECVSVCVCV